MYIFQTQLDLVKKAFPIINVKQAQSWSLQVVNLIISEKGGIVSTVKISSKDWKPNRNLS